jgi:hypothetical protein
LTPDPFSVLDEKEIANLKLTRDGAIGHEQLHFVCAWGIAADVGKGFLAPFEQKHYSSRNECNKDAAVAAALGERMMEELDVFNKSHERSETHQDCPANRQPYALQPK